ncbi:isoprenyl transferase [Mesorhizobium sp. J428]|uniref:isoprenyl transferase n=1 Tax=Mesorhizobium sp. J428 TaxID=2898440 RepID=UPI0035B05100|nr:isoprenyl transferase [Mesorhizobium sp. J428]
MDGNGRWAQERGLPRAAGHRAGVEALRQMVQNAADLGIGWVTVYAFSSENWSRPKSEVTDLMGLLKLFIRRDLAELHQNGVKVQVIGERQSLQRDISALLDEAEQLTRDNTGLHLVIAFNYGSRDEVARAATKIAEAAIAGRLAPGDITPETFCTFLDTAEIPDPDLIIRTGGEIRLSNFLLWQAAYSELVFLSCYWPDFNKTHLVDAIQTFAARERRFGGVREAGVAS